METIQILSLIALVLCAGVMMFHLSRLIKWGAPKEFSKESGSVAQGVLYSNTGAMMPNQKESAYLHLPSYAAGMLFHIGIFVSLLLYLVSLFDGQHYFPQWLSYLLGGGVAITAICGVSLFIKRLTNPNLRNLTCPDDYLANFVATLIQVATVLFLLLPDTVCISIFYYVATIILFLYMPVGKLKHVVYYFSARYHLGFFYGRRNVWPPQDNQNNK